MPLESGQKRPRNGASGLLPSLRIAAGPCAEYRNCPQRAELRGELAQRPGELARRAFTQKTLFLNDLRTEQPGAPLADPTCTTAPAEQDGQHRRPQERLADIRPSGPTRSGRRRGHGRRRRPAGAGAASACPSRRIMPLVDVAASMARMHEREHAREDELAARSTSSAIAGTSPELVEDDVGREVRERVDEGPDADHAPDDLHAVPTGQPPNRRNGERRDAGRIRASRPVSCSSVSTGLTPRSPSHGRTTSGKNAGTNTGAAFQASTRPGRTRTPGRRAG